MWLQQDLDGIRAVAKRRFRNSWPGNCSSCMKWIKCDMYRHVVTYHLDFGQLWRCPVSWCTVCKGTPQDCMDHLRGRTMCHGTLNRLVWRKQFRLGPSSARQTDALKSCHSGVSTDVFLFSEINLSLAHHYRVYKRGCRILRFGEITSHVCVCLCCRKRHWHSVIWWSPSLLGRQDVPVAGCGLLVFGTNLSVLSFRP